jgi:uroporphyrinogen III methyltransferase / synthase
MTTKQAVATVYLVGAGPGDPGLLTVAGARALGRAGVVVYDYLANPELLKLAPAAAELVYVGKIGNQHTKSQQEINAILVEKARELFAKIKNRKSKIENALVVRLKGGDPYVFGRGGEEAEYLRAQGVPFVVVPGVTSGIAAPAYAGIPVTHRDFTSTITLITGHEKEEAGTGGGDRETGRQGDKETRGTGDDGSEPVPGKGVAEEGGEGLSGRVNYEALAKLEGTLVFYMGIKALPRIVERLMAAGSAPGTPAAVIRWGTRTNQQTVTGTLATIVEEVRKAGIKAPAITLVGKVVGLRPTLNWFEERPLFGQRILVTRTRQQASELSEQLAELGARVLEAPTIEIVAPGAEELPEIDRHLAQLPAYDWVVFTSANGVRAAWERLREAGFDARHFAASNVAAIGPATAEALEEIGIYPDLIPEKFVAEELAEALKASIGEDGEEIRHKRFLLLRADIARPVLREELLKLGAIVEDVAIYRTVKPAGLPEEVGEALAEEAVDWVTFTSASTARNLWELLTAEQRQVIARAKRASIGPITTAALAKLGHGQWAATVEAGEHDIGGLLRAIRGEGGETAKRGC